MRRRDLLVGAAAFTALPALAAPDPDAPLPWTLLAASHHVLRARLRAPVDELRRRQAEGDHAYVDLHLDDPEALYGELASTPPRVRFYSRPLDFAPQPTRIIELDGLDVLACLSLLSQEFNQGLYFAGFSPEALRPATDDLLASTRAELAEQAALLDTWLRRRPEDQEPEEAVVRALVRRLGEPGEVLVAWMDLHAMGPRAAPALVRVMDDRRPVGAASLPLLRRGAPEDQPAWFRPQVVIDAVSALLNELTGQAFGAILNGASEAERQAEARAWRVWRMKQPDAPR